MPHQRALRVALEDLGGLLAERNEAAELVVIGGAALLLSEAIDRPTLDVDVLARFHAGRLRQAVPLPRSLVQAVDDVALLHGLQRSSEHGRAWLNTGPAIQRRVGLPDGFTGRLTRHAFAALGVHVPALVDLVALKLWAATSLARGARRAVDVDDLRRIAAPIEVLARGLRWCAELDGRPDFWAVDAAPVLVALGHTVAEVRNA